MDDIDNVVCARQRKFRILGGANRLERNKAGSLPGGGIVLS